MMGQHKSQRADDVRNDLPKNFAFDQGLAHQAEFVILEIAQAAMYQLGGPGRCPAGQVVHLAKKYGAAAARRITRDPASVDAASDDREIEHSVQGRPPRSALVAISHLAFGLE